MALIRKIGRITKKGLKYLKKYGFFATVKKVLKTLYFRFLYSKKEDLASILAGLVKLDTYSTVIVFENNFGWNKIMKQRPQQIAENLPDDVLMFYHSHEDCDYDVKERIKTVKPNLIVVDLGYFRDVILNFLANHYNKYLMVYSTDYIPYERIQMYEEYRYKVIYEYVDDLNEELSGEAYNDLVERHSNILKDKNVYIVSTATKLKKKIESVSKKEVALITNGVDYNHFQYKEYDIPKDLKSIREKYETILCYYGALANWFDYDLIKKVAKNKKYAIALIGQDYDNTLSKSGILDIDNVFFLGRKAYDELPAYGCNIDICIIPFVINEITESTSPVKLFEYMAMEKPIVTTALPECKKYKSVFYAEDYDGFVANIEKACKVIKDEDYKQLLKSEAEQNTWKSKAKNLVSFVNNQSAWDIKNNINEILSKNEYSRIIVWRSPFGWNVPLFQRPQHIARQFAKQGCLVFYEVSPKTDKVIYISEVEENLYLINYDNYVQKHCFEECLAVQNKPVYIQVYSTNWSMSVEEIEEYNKKGFKLLYEYIDDISPELAGTEEIPQYILDKYNYAMNNKDVPVVTTAKQIYDDVVEKRGTENMVFSCNGVDYDYFQKLDAKYKFEESFLNIVNNGKINVCYYGALAKWFDYDLIKRIDKEGKYNIVLIGVKYDDSYDESGIDNLENVYFIGPKDYHILKEYAAKMDILTIPFVINSITQATSPLKLFEYMALHKPIITTAMQECMKYESVMIAHDHKEFIKLLEKAVKMKDDPNYISLLDKEALDNDWSHKAEVIIKLLKGNEEK